MWILRKRKAETVINYSIKSRYLLCSFLWMGALFGAAPEQKQWEEYLQLMQDYPESIGRVGDAERGVGLWPYFSLM